MPKMNLGFGCACLLAVGGALMGFLRRVYRSYKCKKRWWEGDGEAATFFAGQGVN